MSSMVRRSASRICSVLSTRIGCGAYARVRDRGQLDGTIACACLFAARSTSTARSRRPNTRSSRSTITDSCTAKASTRRCAPTTGCRSSTTGTCAGCARSADRFRSTCRSTTRRWPAWIARHGRRGGRLRRSLHPRPAHPRRRRADLRRRRHPRPLARHHRQAARRPCRRGSTQRRHRDLAGPDPAQPSRLGEPDHQVEQPAEQRAGDAAGQPARRAKRR